MKTKSVLTVLTAAGLLIGIAGCKKQEPAAPTTAATAADQTKAAAGSTVDAVKSAATTAQTAVKAATDKAQAIIDKAKSLVNAGKLQDALTALNGLSGMTLADAQQKIVDGLKAQIQKAIADQAAKQAAGAVGNLLGK